MQLLSSHRLLCLCLGRLRCPVINLKLRGGGQKMVSLHLVARPPPQYSKIPSPIRGPCPQTSDDNITSDVRSGGPLLSQEREKESWQ